MRRGSRDVKRVSGFDRPRRMSLDRKVPKAALKHVGGFDPRMGMPRDSGSCRDLRPDEKHDVPLVEVGPLKDRARHSPGALRLANLLSGDGSRGHTHDGANRAGAKTSPCLHGRSPPALGTVLTRLTGSPI